MSKKPQPLTREQSLDAVVVASNELKIKEREDGGITLLIPFKQTPWLAKISKWLGAPTGGERPLELDEIGAFVWRMCDGTKTVRDMIEALQDRYKLNRKDAEASLTAFIRILVGKRLVLLAVRNNK